MTRVVAPAFAHTSGPRTAKIAFVGEAWGEQEALTGRPFVGNAGQELSRLLLEAGIPRAECFLTNVLAARPPDNKLDAWCGSRAEVGKDYVHAPLRQGKYLRTEFLGELTRLREELTVVAPNLVVALGGTALWALAGTSAIGALRGTTHISKLCPGQKMLATYHPSYLFKMWSHRPIVLADLMKAKHEGAFPEVRRPAREVLVHPTFEEMEAWYCNHAANALMLAVDIETRAGQISDIGFASSRKHAIVLTFLDPRADDASYWRDSADEVRAWKFVQRLLALPAKKVMQNGIYDMSYLMRQGLRVRNAAEDTMLLHHSMYPELQKGLGFLGSIYTSESAWKLLGRHKAQDVLKADE